MVDYCKIWWFFLLSLIFFCFQELLSILVFFYFFIIVVRWSEMIHTSFYYSFYSKLLLLVVAYCSHCCDVSQFISFYLYFSCLLVRSLNCLDCPCVLCVANIHMYFFFVVVVLLLCASVLFSHFYYIWRLLAPHLHTKPHHTEVDYILFVQLLLLLLMVVFGQIHLPVAVLFYWCAAAVAAAFICLCTFFDVLILFLLLFSVGWDMVCIFPFKIFHRYIAVIFVIAFSIYSKYRKPNMPSTRIKII